MKRAIKFRAWDKKNQCFLSQSITKELEVTIRFDGVFVSDDMGIDGTESGDRIILSQFTGLPDKNGKEIYEGDILKHDLWGVSQIIWEHGMFRGVGNDHDVTLADHQLQRSRVIGNIYQHPNLLKGELL